jgi:hypothetical protein
MSKRVILLMSLALFVFTASTFALAQNQKGEAKPVDDNKETGVVPNQGEAVVGLEARSDSDWLDLKGFGEKLETLPKSHYPFEIQGRPLKGDGTQWRAFFAQIPDDQFQYRVAFGKTDKEYTTLWRKYKKEGFTCIDHQSFTAMSGTLHQAIWVNTKAQKQFKTLTTEIDQLSPDQRNVNDPLKAIRDPSAAVRYFAICKLDPANSEKHEDALLAGLDDDICWLRYAAAVRLADTKRNVDIIAPILVESLGHDDNTFFPWDNRFVCPALYKIGDAALVHLNATIDSPNRTLRSRGCYMMGSMFSVSKDRKLYQKTLEALNEAISNNMFPSSRPMYVTTRMKIDGDIDRAEKLIREDAQSNDVAICRAALGRMKHFDSAGERFLPLIIKTLEERKELRIVRAAVTALWRIHDGHRSSVGVPVDLSSCVPSIVVQLEQQKDVRLQGHLLRFLEDTDNAKHCPVEPIIEILSGKDDVNHDAALEVLYAMGLSAKPAQSILWKMRDSDRSMSKDQRELLMSLITFLRYGHK